MIGALLAGLGTAAKSAGAATVAGAKGAVAGAIDKVGGEGMMDAIKSKDWGAVGEKVGEKIGESAISGGGVKTSSSSSSSSMTNSAMEPMKLTPMQGRLDNKFYGHYLPEHFKKTSIINTKGRVR